MGPNGYMSICAFATACGTRGRGVSSWAKRVSTATVLHPWLNGSTDK